MKTQSYKDLIVWQKAILLANLIYGVTRLFPSDERFGLTIQMRRAAVSIPSNIAEGCERRSGGDIRRFFLIALGSLSELETQLLIAKQQGFVTHERYISLDQPLRDVGRLIHCFIKKV